MIILDVACDNADELLNASAFGTGALLRVESSATQAGSYVEVATEPLVSGTRLYTIYDASGDSGTWYRSRYSTAAPAVSSDYSAYGSPFQAGGPTEAYVGLSTFRAFVRNQASGTTDEDNAIELMALEAAARAIDRECGRNFRLANGLSARTFQAGISTTKPAWPFLYRRYAVDVDDFFDTAGMTVMFDMTGNGGYTQACTTYRVGPVNAPSKGMPYTRLLFDLGTIPVLHEDGIQATTNWGWPAYPANVVNANLIQASRFLKRRDSPYGIAGSPDLGNEMRLLAKLDPDVALLLRPYKLEWGNV